MMNKIKALFKNTAFNLFVIFALSGLVLYFTMRNDGETVIRMISGSSKRMLVFLIVLMIIDKALLGYGLMLECRQTHPRYSWWKGFVNAYVAGLFNNITPGASGGQVAQGYIFRKQGIPVSHSVGILWLDFIVYQSTMCIYVLLLIIFKFPYFYSNYSEYFVIVIFGFLVGSGIIGFLWALAKMPRFYQWLTTSGINIGHKLHIIKNKEAALDKLNELLAAFAKEIVVLSTHKKMIVKLVIITVLRLTLQYSIPFFCARALHIDVSASVLFNIIALSAFVAMVNAFLPMPGSSGGTEATFVLMFSTIFQRGDAASIMILWRSVTFYMTLIIGGVIFAYARTRENEPLEEALPRTYAPEAMEHLEDDL